MKLPVTIVRLSDDQLVVSACLRLGLVDLVGRGWLID